MKTFIVAHVDFFDNDIKLEKIEAPTWQEAVEKHSKYPYKETEESSGQSAAELSKNYPDYTPEESFKQACFDCDSMMNWFEL